MAHLEGPSHFKLLLGISAAYIILIPLVFIFFFAGGIVQSDVGHPIPHLRVLGGFEQLLALALFISASSSWAFYKYGLVKVAWTVLVIPLFILVSILAYLVVYNHELAQCEGHLQDNPGSYCERTIS
jgi:hypothetical protein